MELENLHLQPQQKIRVGINYQVHKLIKGGEYVINKKNKITFNTLLNSIAEDKKDPTVLLSSFLIHDFEISGNNGLISEETCAENMHTLLNKPIVATYVSKEENDGIDGLEGHGITIDLDRETDEPFVSSNSVSIGTITNVYIDVVEGTDKKALFADATLWLDKQYNICALIKEWYDEGVVVNSSMECLYSNYIKNNKVTEILSPFYYVGHCILGSKQCGDNLPIVTPAYKSSKMLSLNEEKTVKFERLVAEAIEKESLKCQSDKTDEHILNQDQKEEVSMSQKIKTELNEQDLFRKVFELSHEDIRSKIYCALRETITADEYYDAYVIDVFDDYFVLSLGYNKETVKINYTKNDAEVFIDISSKTPVKFVVTTEYVATTSDNSGDSTVVEDIDSSMNSAEAGDGVEQKKEVSEVVEPSEVEKLQAELTTIKTEKEELVKQFNEATEKLVALNAEVEELKPIKVQFETEKLEKLLNEKIEYFSTKFEAVKAKEKFENEEVQNLIKLSINETEEGKNAVLQLNSMLVELVQPVTTKEQPLIKEFASKKMHNLLPVSDSFEDRYKE
jgi:hypothetical protein